MARPPSPTMAEEWLIGGAALTGFLFLVIALMVALYPWFLLVAFRRMARAQMNQAIALLDIAEAIRQSKGRP